MLPWHQPASARILHPCPFGHWHAPPADSDFPLAGMLKELRCRIVICWLPWLRIIRHSGHAKRAHRRAGAMGAFGFPQKAYGHQKLIIKHLSQGEAKSAGGSQWTNGLRHLL